MRRIKNDGLDLLDEIRSPAKDAGARIRDRYQRELAVKMARLDEIKQKLETAAKKRDGENSKRWLAHFDYAVAQVNVRLAYVQEYNQALGDVVANMLPELDPKIHSGWRLAVDEKMQSPPAVRDQAERGLKALAAIAKDHPGTPWSVLAKAQRNTKLGLCWLPRLKASADVDPK